MKRIVWILIPLILVIGCVVKGRHAKKERPGSGKQSGTPATQAVPVEVAPVTVGRMDRTLAITGDIKVDEEVEIASKISGRVRFVAAKAGDRVTRGQVLAALEETDLRAQVQIAQATLRSARARLAQLRAGEGMRFSQTNTRIEQARASLEAAKVRVSQLEIQAQITETQTSAQVQEAEAALAASSQRLSMMREGMRKQEKAQSQLAVTQAKANYDNAKGYSDRRRQLFQSGAVSKEMVEEAERQLKVAEAQYQSAQEQANLVQEGFRSQEVRMAEEEVRRSEETVRQAKANVSSNKIRKEDIASAKIQVKQAEVDVKNALAGNADIRVTREEIHAAEASVQQAEGAVALAREQLGNARIVSPVNAVVVSRTVNVGEIATPGMPMMRIVAVDTAYFEGNVPEIDVSELTPGFPVDVTIDSSPGKVFRGTLRKIIPLASTANRSFRVRISVPLGSSRGGGELVKPGSFARGQVILSSNPKARIVPKIALLKRDGKDVLYVVRQGLAQERTVTTGVIAGEKVEAKSGVEAGDQVVTSGADALQDGSKVKVVTKSNKE